MELMNKPTSTEDYLNIDWNTRVITADITNLGVYNDKDSNRLYFRCPATYGDCNVADYGIRVNYVNTGASGQEYDGDIYLVDDAEVEDGYITFSWLVGRRAYLEQGTTAFIVCCKIADSDGNVVNELNTTVMRLDVLEGLEINVSTWESEYPDIIEELLQKADEALKAAESADNYCDQVDDRARAAQKTADEALEKADEALKAAATANNYCDQVDDRARAAQKTADEAKETAESKVSSVNIGTVTTGDSPAVTNSGTDKDVVLDFTFPSVKVYTTFLDININLAAGETSAEQTANININGTPLMAQICFVGYGAFADIVGITSDTVTYLAINPQNASISLYEGLLTVLYTE